MPLGSECFTLNIPRARREKDRQRMSCRKCRTPKWKGDPCPNPDCSINMTVTVQLRARSKPITVAVKHGFHAENQQTIGCGYDAPIRATRWVGMR